MPQRWNIEGEDSAAIFGAIHRGLITIDFDRTSEVQLAPAIKAWLTANPSLPRKYDSKNFHNNFGRNFRNIVARYEKWKRDPSKCAFVSIALFHSLILTHCLQQQVEAKFLQSILKRPT
jgi:hypothetical protein